MSLSVGAQFGQEKSASVYVNSRMYTITTSPVCKGGKLTGIRSSVVMLVDLDRDEKRAAPLTMQTLQRQAAIAVAFRRARNRTAKQHR